MYLSLKLIFCLYCFPGIIDCQSVSVFGTITDDTFFYYKKIPASPSKSATFESSVLFRAPNNADYVNLFFYTTDKHVNIDKKCSVKNYGQVKYDDIHIEFSFNRRLACHRKGDQLECHSFRRIQDFIPRNFAFSFGFYCKEKSNKSLKGLSYNITINFQTNDTSCSAMPETVINCTQYYSEVSLPNLIDHEDKEDAAESLNRAFLTETFLGEEIFDCYQHFVQTVCYLFLPRCNATSNNFIVPCRETYEELREECLGGVQFSSIPENVLSAILSTYDYEYLPSRFGPIQCYYEEVICKSPPNVTGAEIVEGLNENGTYVGGSEVQFLCTDDSKEIIGNSTVRCLYSGRWSAAPTCDDRQFNNLLKILLPTFILVVLSPIVVVVAVCIYKRRRRYVFKKMVLRRRRQFDAYVCYDFDEDFDFVMETVLPALENNHDPPFKLCLHSREYDPGSKIFDNIRESIDSSNTAIIVMSQAFVHSRWCKAEFEQCFIENLDDPAFKLFLIMMQDADTLVDMTEYMRTFVAQRTYLEKTDPHLFQKIAEYLTEVKKPEEHDDKNNINGADNNVVNDVNNVNNADNEGDLRQYAHSFDIELAEIGPV